MKKVLTVGPEDFRDRVKDVLGFESQVYYEASTNDDALEIHAAENVDMIVAMQETPGMATDVFCSRIRNVPELNDVAIVIACMNSSSDTYSNRNVKANDTIYLDEDDHSLADKLKAHLNIPRRLSYRVVTRIRIDAESDATMLYGVIQNLSTTGMLVESGSRLEKGDELEFSFFLPKSRRIHAKGEVIRIVKVGASDTAQYGIRFKDLDRASKENIYNFVEDRT